MTPFLVSFPTENGIFRNQDCLVSRKSLNSPLVWTHKGPWNLSVVTSIVPRGLLAKRKILHHCLGAQHVEW